MCSMVVPWPDSIAPWMSFCIFAKSFELAIGSLAEDLLPADLERVAWPSGRRWQMSRT